jgi:putative hydrolase of the HAD superfamily
VIRAVSFDAVGTLIAPAAPVGRIYADTAARHGVIAGAEALDAAFPDALRLVRGRWVVPYGADEADARRFWTEVVRSCFAAAGVAVDDTVAADCYDTFAAPPAWRVLPGTRAALADADAAGLPMAVISNFDRRLAPLLTGLGLGPFVAVITSAEAGTAKPDPCLLHLAAARLGVPPQDVLHVGDSASEDGGMCAAAGCGFLLVDPAVGVQANDLRAALNRAAGAAAPRSGGGNAG